MIIKAFTYIFLLTMALSWYFTEVNNLLRYATVAPLALAALASLFFYYRSGAKGFVLLSLIFGALAYGVATAPFWAVPLAAAPIFYATGAVIYSAVRTFIGWLQPQPVQTLPNPTYRQIPADRSFRHPADLEPNARARALMTNPTTVRSPTTDSTVNASHTPGLDLETDTIRADFQRWNP